MSSIRKALLLEHLNTCIPPVGDLQVSPGSWYFIPSSRVNLVSYTIQRFILVFSIFPWSQKAAECCYSPGAGETNLAVGLIFPLRSEISHTGRLMIPHQRLPLLLLLSIIVSAQSAHSWRRLAYPPPLTSEVWSPRQSFSRAVLLRGGLRSIIPSCYRLCSTLYKALVSSQVFLRFKHNQSL